MSSPSELGDDRSPLVDVDDLREAGVEVSDEVEYAEVPEGSYVLDDDDAGECRYAADSELRPMYIDNAVGVEGIQHDVWTLTIDDSDEFVFHMPNGATAIVRWGDIDVNPGPVAPRYLLRDMVVWPTTDYQDIMLNDTTTPRLAHLKRWMLEQLAERSEQRLEMAEIVHAFTSIISHNSGPLGL